MDMMNSTTSSNPATASIADILHPRSVAIVGASNDETKWGGRLLRYMTRHRIAGELYPINPRGDVLMGVQSYSSIAECPGPVDMAVLLVPGSRALDAVRDCAANGVKVAVAITSGFAEAGAQGAELEQTLVREARQAGMRLIGPNCMGLLNTRHNLAATTAVTMGYVDKLPVGGIGMASQSGALMGAMLARGVDLGAGFSTLVSLGNQSDIDQNDIFEYLIHDPGTQIISLYIEAVKGPARFMSLLQQARMADKPVLIVKSGRTAAGERAVKSHTASLAGAWPSFAAVCRAQGAYLFDNVYDLLGGAMVLQRGQRMAKPGVAVFSGSGGGGALFVDALDEIGQELPSLAEATQQNLAEVLPASHRHLPVDFGVINAAAAPDSKYGGGISTAIGRVMEDPAVGAGLVFLTTQPGMDKVAASVATVGSQCGKPLLFVHGASTVGEAARAVLRDHAYGYVESPNDAVKIIQALWQRETMPATSSSPDPVPAASLPDLPATGYLTEPAARRLLESVDIPTSAWRVAKSPADAAHCARELGGKVVVKAISGTLVHKSDIGAVKLDLQGDDAVVAACEDIGRALQAAGHALDGFLVTAMLRADAELIVGIQRDPDFGPMVMVGAGGVLVELMRDVQLCPAPLSIDQANAMIDALRCRPLIEGYRGRPPVDRQQLAQVLVRLGQLAAGLPVLTELDINPLMIVDGRVVAADARAVLA